MSNQRFCKTPLKFATKLSFRHLENIYARSLAIWTRQLLDSLQTFFGLLGRLEAFSGILFKNFNIKAFTYIGNSDGIHDVTQIQIIVDFNSYIKT